MKRTPQRVRVLRALRRYPNGICQADFHPPNVIDGGDRISRLAARVRDLKDEGHEIEVDGERYGYTVYKLPQPKPVTIPPPEPVIPMDEDAPADVLFDLPTQRPARIRSPYDEAA